MSPFKIGCSALLTLVLASACGTGSSGEVRVTEPASGPVRTTVDPGPSTGPASPGPATTEPAATEPTTTESRSPAERPTTTPSAQQTTSTTTTSPPRESATFEAFAGMNTIPDFAGYTSRGLARWEQEVPGIEDLRIASTADGSEQPALWLAPSGDVDRPLLVILHSWSAPYHQHAGIPYAMWARENGWAMIAPHFKGINDDPEAIGSDLAVQAVVDAIDFATSRPGVNADRVYAVGYSGGGMMSLLLAGRHPEMVSAVVAWGPPYDLVEFYRRSLRTGRRYANDITIGCGGDPTSSASALEELIVHEVILPKTGMYEGDVVLVEWLVDDGVAVAAGQPIFVMETDKVEMEIEADVGGWLEHEAAPGFEAAIGTRIGRIHETEAGYAEARARS